MAVEQAGVFRKYSRFLKKNRFFFELSKNPITFAVPNGAIALLVEQRTENPCVPGSIPGGTTKRELKNGFSFFCILSAVR